MPNALQYIKPLAEIEEAAIRYAVVACDGNLSLACKLLKIGRSTLYRKLEGYAWGSNYVRAMRSPRRRMTLTS